MKERTIKLTLDEGDVLGFRHVFLITLNEEYGAEIRVAGSPVVSRDSSVVTHVGVEPMIYDLTVYVEEVP